ncbi:bumetanide-sensitive sodium-(potassium)-chloride cotransporter-like [Nymphalis io]|uniref:bumetanide-sensitive sodium-(potassium)-chloride cotransporter-like n=1 Tax=Inachis io TaxID=171585 RepID=UPI00216A60C0|nr:bumetanide-sensitive sodium-(potassium)-chloride cotransporter-like [Nymphalis io]
MIAVRLDEEPTSGRHSEARIDTRVGAALIATSGHHEDEGNIQDQNIEPTPELTTYNIKLGWIQGVLIPCLLNIWGVMLFLRISWIVGQAGICLTVLIIFLSSVVCVITTLSLSAICTNGLLKGGGVYYIVSRSLGAELGASVGIIFAFANAVAASMNTIGFCESLNDLLKSFDVRIIDNGLNDVRIVGTIALFVMCIICAFGMDWETKAQNFLVVIIVVSILNYILGACLGPSNDSERAQGFVGISVETALVNLGPDFRYSDNQQHNFFSVFAMYFPAVTGVQAGANICGDLKSPATAIPKGTFLALGLSMLSYLVMAVLCGVGALRDASGNIADVNSGTIDACIPNCKYGLHNNYGIMQLMAQSSALIYAGCWAATLSTALTNLLSVPRLIQALGVDRIYPGLIFFSKPYGKHGEPYRGYVLTFFVSLAFLLIADLNTIAPLITNFYLASYALINFCTFHAGLIQSINWRPTFRFYNTWLSLFGFLICIFIMMIISWAMALVTFFIFMTLYLLVLYRKPDVNWGSSTDAQRYKDTVSALIQMSHMHENIKSYNPQVLVLAGRPNNRPALLDIGHLITKLGSFMVVADVNEEPISKAERVGRLQAGEEWLLSRKDRGFYVVLDGLPFEVGVHAIIRSTGLGSLKPNILLIGYMNRWTRCAVTSVRTYVRVLQLAFEEQLGVSILRVPETARPVKQHVTRGAHEMRMQTHVQDLLFADSDTDMPQHGHFNGDYFDMFLTYNTIFLLYYTDEAESSHPELGLVVKETVASFHDSDPTKNTPVSSLSMRKSGVYKPLSFSPDNDLDAWWLYDDGGLNILLPYIIARRGFTDKMPLRIFALTRDCNDIQDSEKHIKALLQKFRIEYSSLIMIQGINEPPMQASLEYFNQLIKKFRTDFGSDILISDAELERLRNKTNRHLRLRELLVEHSYMASFIVLTLPYPRLGSVSATLYMSWLEVLSKDLPPVLFVRGNDETVLGV